MTLKFWFAGKESCWYYSLSPGTSGEKLPGAGEGARCTKVGMVSMVTGVSLTIKKYMTPEGF